MMTSTAPTTSELTIESREAKGGSSSEEAGKLPGGELADLVRHVPEVGVLPVELGVHAEGAVGLPRGLEGGREVVAQSLVLLVAAAGGLEPLLEPFDGQLGHSLLEETDAEHAAALEDSAVVLGRELELGDRLVDEPHLLVGDPEVVASVVVFLAELLVDPLLELLEYVREPRVSEVRPPECLTLLDHRGLRPEQVAQLGPEVDAAFARVYGLGGGSFEPQGVQRVVVRRLHGRRPPIEYRRLEVERRLVHQGGDVVVRGQGRGTRPAGGRRSRGLRGRGP